MFQSETVSVSCSRDEIPTRSSQTTNGDSCNESQVVQPQHTGMVDILDCNNPNVTKIRENSPKVSSRIGESSMEGSDPFETEATECYEERDVKSEENQNGVKEPRVITTERTESMSSDNRSKFLEIEMKESDDIENRLDGYKDKGWAWVIAVVGLWSILLSVGAYRYLSLLLVELTDIYDEPVTKFALIFTWNGIGFCSIACLYILGLGEIFHERAQMVAGGIICAIGFISGYFSTRLEHVYILGFCAGVGCQFGPMAGTNLLGKYFDKRLALANGIAVSGVSLGTLILPPFVQILFDEYGYRGASLVMAAVSLNCLVCAALMRPVPQKVQKTEELPVSDHISKDFSTNDEKDNNVHVMPKRLPLHDRPRQSRDFLKEREIINVQDIKDVSHGVNSDELRTVNSVTNASRSVELIVANGKNTGREDQNRKRLSEHTKEANMSFSNKAFVGELERDVVDYNRSNYGHSYSVQTESIRGKRSQTILQDLKNYVFKPQDVSNQRSSKLKSLLLGFGYFKDPSFVFFQLFAFIATLAAECLVQFIPALAVELGTSQRDSGYLMSIIGAGDLLSRIVTGFIGDYVNRTLVVVVPQIILGAACFLTQFATQFWAQIIFASVVGLTYGVTYAFETVLLIDYFGLSGLSRTLGMTNLLGGVGFIAGGPIVGSLRDLTGNYTLAVQFLGCCFFISGLCMVGVKLSRLCCPRKCH